MLSLRTRIFIAISLVILVVLSISILVWVLSKRSVAPASQTTPTEQANLPEGTVIVNGNQVMVSPIAQGLTPKPLTSLETEQNGVKQVARIFIERYNSYSTDADFQNIRDVKGLVTDAFWAQISKPLAGSSSGSASFVGVTTNVMSTELSNWQDTNAQVDVKTVSVEDRNGVQSTRQRTAVVTLVKVGSQWLVDNFGWQK